MTKSQVYAENTREEANTALRDLLTREALDYGLACSETAFVAVRKEAGRVIEGSIAVANALPAGWSDGFTGFNTGALPKMAFSTSPTPMPQSAQSMPPAATLFGSRPPARGGGIMRALKNLFSASDAPPPTADMFAADIVAGA